VIEDEPITRMDAVLLLEEAGYDVKEFVVVDKAVAYLDARAAIVIFVFTDVHTPGELNGLHLAELVRDRWPWIKIVITSGTVSDIEDRIPPGSTFLRKPWRPSEVLAHAETAFRH
jgi:two-component system, response regulator PdtaR